jgi:PadR family transcriptional regulator, regulatory protein PadR
LRRRCGPQGRLTGPPRRYYRLTNEGRAALDAFTVQWRQFRDAIDNLLDGGRAR